MPKKEEISEEQETHDESELEEEIKKDEPEEIAEKVSGEDSTGKLIDDTSFREFIQPSTKSTAPVLEKIADAQEMRWVRREGDFQEKNENENQVNYSLNKNGGDEIKYDEPSKEFNQNVFVGTKPNISSTRNNLNTNSREFTFTTPESQKMERDLLTNPTKEYIEPKRFEQDNKKMPFERKDKKYKEFKPSF